MNATIKSLGIDLLSVDDQITLVGEIWDNIATNHPEAIELTDGQKAELDRRITDYEANPGIGISWEEVKASALTRINEAD